MKLPQDTETVKFLPWSQYDEISLYELYSKAFEYFPDASSLDIFIDRLEIQVDCFGYDLYDPSDYRWYYIFEHRTPQ